ncbi:MAG: pilus assembly protein PilM [Candidatus Brocadiaceae bacterium]|uniref:pilus assembly protein PilM n=1 Tax=Candidatus Wunengus sp. YC61 TaxID=3367698 RepID=UPI00271B3716|nr:pilus assembly protein PilM [Candidatus Brocadiaceae bacterium]
MIKLRQLRFAPKIRGFDTQKLSQALKHYRAKTAWGLDIGSHALKAVKITQTSGALLIEDADIIEYPVFKPDVNFLQSQHIKEAIQIFLAKHHIAKTDNVLVSIPGQFVLSRFTTVPPVDKKQLKDVVSYEAKQQIPFDLKDIVWDYQQLSEQVPATEGIEIGLFASKRTTLDQILTNIVSLMPGLTALQVSPLAIANLIFFDRQVDGPSIIINIETENTDIVVVDSLHLWLRSITLSTVDADLVKEIQRSMEYYKSLTKEEVHFKSILLMGNRFKDANNVKFITDNFTYEVKVLKTLNNLKLSDKINPDFLNENLVNMGVALGLALQGLGAGRININLLPLEQIKAAEISRKKPYAMATLCCLALILVIQYIGLHIRINHLRDSNNYHQNVLQNIKELEKKYKSAETLAQTYKSALDLVSSIDASRFFWMEALDKLLSLIPQNVAITSINSSWLSADTLQTKDAEKQTTKSNFFQAKKASEPAKPGSSKKLLLMGIKGESKEPRMGFIEENVLKPLQKLSLFDQKVPAFKNVEIAPGSCRQIDRKNDREGCISFEIRWIVKSQDEIQSETQSLIPGTATASVKS